MDNQQVIDLIVEALEKELPKRVIQINIGEGYRCPNCRENRFWKDGRCCKDCGQLLDWRA